MIYVPTRKFIYAEPNWYLILGDNRCVEHIAFWLIGIVDKEQLNED